MLHVFSLIPLRACKRKALQHVRHCLATFLASPHAFTTLCNNPCFSAGCSRGIPYSWGKHDLLVWWLCRAQLP